MFNAYSEILLFLQLLLQLLLKLQSPLLHY